MSDGSGLVTTTVINTKLGELENKIPDTSGLATTAVLTTKIGEAENEVLDLSDLAKRTVCGAKISEIKGKSFFTSNSNKFTSDILDAKIKQNKLVDKSDLEAKLATSATNVELKAEHDKMVKLQMHDLTSFLGKIILDNDGSQNMFIYQPTFNVIDFK